MPEHFPVGKPSIHRMEASTSSSCREARRTYGHVGNRHETGPGDTWSDPGPC